MLLLPSSRSPNTSTPVIPGKHATPFWAKDNVVAVLEDGQLLLQSGRIAQRTGTAEVRTGQSVDFLMSRWGKLIAHRHAVRRASFPPPVLAVTPGGLEGLVRLTRAGVRELWFVDVRGASKIKFPGARAAQFLAATSVTVPVWGQRDDTFFIILDESLPTEKTWVVTLNRPAPGGAMKHGAPVTKLVELATTSGVSPAWFVPAGATPVDVFSDHPYLDATNHLILAVGYRPADFGVAALLNLTKQTVLLTVSAAAFGPPTFGGPSGSNIDLTVLHLDRAAPKHSRIIAAVIGEGFDGAPIPAFHTSQGLFVTDGAGDAVLTVAAFAESGGGALGSPFFTGPAGTRRHVLWNRATGPLAQRIFMTDVYSKVTVDLGVETDDGLGVLSPAVLPQVTFIRPDFAVRLANTAAPYFVKWWDKKTGKILLTSPLTDAMLQTEDPDLKGKKKLAALPADVTASGYAYHVIEGSRFFPYLADRKNPG